MKEGTKAKSNAPIKCKNMMYVQKISYLPAGIQTKEALAELIAKELNPTRYAVIAHDKEVDENGNPKETDIHAMLCFDNARYLRSVAKKIGDKEQSIERWNGDANNGFPICCTAQKMPRKSINTTRVRSLPTLILWH